MERCRDWRKDRTGKEGENTVPPSFCCSVLTATIINEHYYYYYYYKPCL